TAAGRTVSLERSSPLLQLDEHGLPIHGLLTASPHWMLEQVRADERAAALTATFDFASHADLLAAFPFPHRLQMDVRLTGTELSLTTTVTPGDVDVPLSLGYH